MPIGKTTSKLYIPKLLRAPNKAYSISEGALKSADSHIRIESCIARNETTVVPKRGLLTDIRQLYIFVKSQYGKKGRWVSIAKDPKGYLPVDETHITVKEFTKENICDAAAKAGKLLSISPKRESICSIPFLPVDTVLITNLFKKRP